MIHETKPEPQAADATKLPARLVEAAKNAIASLIAFPPESPTRQGERCEYISDIAENELSGFHWPEPYPELSDIFNAACRLAKQWHLPTGETVASELDRAGNPTAAARARELGGLFPTDGMAPYWLERLLELSRAAAAYSDAHKIQNALENGQTLAEVTPTIEKLTRLAEPPKGDGLSILSAVDMASLFPALRPYIVDRLLRQGETMNLIAAPKIGKSWLLMALLLAIASGTDWLGYPCQMGRVLLLDNELHPETLAKRITVVAYALGIDLAKLGDMLSVVSLRGQSKDLNALKRTFDRVKPGEYAMVGIDALYRMLPRECEENSNENMRDVYNLLDLYAEQTKAAFTLVHHSSKGDQSQKSVTDTGSGAGAISRAADVHCIIRPHEEPDCAVMDCRIRSGAQPAPLGLRWSYPLWVPDSALDVEALATTTRRKKAASEAADSGPPGYMAVVQFATAEPKPLGWFSAKTNSTDWAARSLLRRAVAVGAIHSWPGKKARDPERWATVPAALE